MKHMESEKTNEGVLVPGVIKVNVDSNKIIVGAQNALNIIQNAIQKELNQILNEDDILIKNKSNEK